MDKNLRSNVEKKMEVAKSLTGTGYHEMLAILYDIEDTSRDIVRKINNEAGEEILKYGSLHGLLINIGCIKKKETHEKPTRHLKRNRIKGVVETGKKRKCLQCDKIFNQTNINHARCPECTKTPGDTTEFYAVNRATGGN